MTDRPGLTTATLQYRSGAAYAPAYDELYHPGGPARAEAVFLRGNGLPTAWEQQNQFVILETGFGLGLNFLLTWAAWLADPKACQRLHIVSIEKTSILCY